MIAQPPHNRKLGLSGVALTKARNNKHDTKALTAVRDELEQLLIGSAYFTDAPFSWVTVAVRYGLKDEIIPHYEKINQKYGDLPLSIEVDTNRLMGASFEDLVKTFSVAILRALIHAAAKYQRPAEQLRVQLLELER
jgi:hypothetical protein